MDTTGIVAEKKKVGFVLPPEIIAVLDQLGSELSRKERWVAVSAAVLLLLQSTPDQRSDLYSEVKAADVPGRSLDPVIKRIENQHSIRKVPPKKRPMDIR